MILKLLPVSYLVKVVIKLLVRSESFCGRRFICFQQDLAINGPQIFDTVLSLVKNTVILILNENIHRNLLPTIIRSFSTFSYISSKFKIQTVTVCVGTLCYGRTTKLVAIHPPTPSSRSTTTKQNTQFVALTNCIQVYFAFMCNIAPFIYTIKMTISFTHLKVHH